VGEEGVGMGCVVLYCVCYCERVEERRKGVGVGCIVLSCVCLV